MNNFKEIFTQILGLVIFLLIVGCISVDNGVMFPGTTQSAFSTNQTTSGAGRIYADAEVLTNVELVALAEMNAVFKDSQNGANAITINFTNDNGNGAGGSDEYLIVSESAANGAGEWGVVGWTFDSTFNMTETNTAIAMYVRSADMAVNSIALKVEGPVGTGSPEVTKTFTADGTWQKVTWTSSELIGSANLSVLGSIVVVFNPALRQTAGQLRLDIDEVQFVFTNIPPEEPVDPVVGNVKVYADSDANDTYRQIVLPSNSIRWDSQLGAGAITLTKKGAGGAGNSDSYYAVNLSGSPEWAVFLWVFDEPYNGTASISDLKFSIRSSNSAVNKIKIKLENEPLTGPAGLIASPEVEMDFTADGTWQDVTYRLKTDTFISSDNVLRDIWKVIFVLSDVNGGTGGIGAQSFDIDEVRFSTNVITIKDQNFSTGTNATNGQIIGIVQANKADSYSIIAGNSNNAFNLNASNGYLSVAASTALTKGDVINLSVQVSNAVSGSTDEARVSVRVTRGDVKVYADSSAYINYSQLSLTNPSISKDAQGGSDTININFITNNTGSGANGSDEYLIVSESSADAAGEWGVVLWTSKESYDGTETDTDLKFFIRSTNTNVNKIKFKLERRGASAQGTPEVERSFTADGSWQELVYPLNTDTFASSAPILADIWKIILVFNPALSQTTDLVVLEIDEVRFDQR